MGLYCIWLHLSMPNTMMHVQIELVVCFTVRGNLELIRQNRRVFKFYISTMGNFSVNSINLNRI